MAVLIWGSLEPRAFSDRKLYVYHVPKTNIISDSSEKVRIKSMRVLLPTGTIMKVAKVVAVCEQRLTYNGRDMRLCEKAADIAYANGIGLFPEVQGSFDVVTGDAVLIGNLANSLVRGVLDSLVRQSYVDLTDLKFQKKQPLVSQYVFDNGASGAYSLYGLDASMACADALRYPFVNGGCPMWSEAEDAGESESEDEDAGEEDCDE